MNSLPAPDEAERLRVLRDYDVLHTPAEPAFEELTRLAAEICEMPIALITLIDAERQWFKARVGIEEESTARDVSFCAHFLDAREVVVVPDATLDARFARNPYVSGTSGIRFYAAAPLVTETGAVLGTLCVLDRKPRTLVDGQRRALAVLSRQVMTEFRLRREVRQQRAIAGRLDVQRARLLEAQAVAKVGSWETDLTTLAVAWSEQTHRIFETDPSGFAPTHEAFLALVHPADRAAVDSAFRESLAARERCRIEHRVRLPDGREKHVEEQWQVFADEAGRPIRAIGTCRDITERKQLEEERQRLVFNLGERVKELRALYQAAELLRTDELPRGTLLARVVALLPAALQFPEIAAARVKFADDEQATADFRRTPWVLEAEFTTSSGGAGRIELVYLDERVAQTADPFLPEERALVQSLSDMLRAHFERRETEQALRESEDRFRLTFVNAAIGMAITDPEGRFVQANPAYCQMLGFTEAELRATTIWEVTLPEDRARERKLVDELFAQARDGFVLEGRYLGVAGRVVWCRVSVSLLRDVNGRPRHVVIVAEDVTTMRAAAQKLAESGRLLRIAGRVAKLGGWTVAVPDMQVSWSDEVAAMHGRPPGYQPGVEEAIGYYVPEDRERVRQAFALCAEAGEPFQIEARLCPAVGRPIHVRAIGEAVREEGRIVRVHGAFLDITAQTEAEASLLESRWRFRQLAEAMPFIVWTAGPTGIVDYSNRRFFRYTGVTANARVRQWMATIHPEDRRPTLRAWAACVNSQEPFETELRLRQGADGSFRWFRLQGSPARDSTGRVVTWYGTAIDVHDAKRLAEDAGMLARRLTTTLESLTDAFLTIDRSWRFTYVNAEAERLLLRRREELVNRNIWECFPEAKGSRFELEYQRALDQAVTVSFEEHYGPLGLWLEVRAYPSVEGLAIYFRDVTERRRNRDALVASEERFREMAENIGDVFFNYDPGANRLLYANRAYEQIWGRPLAEVYADPLKYLEGILPEDRAAAEVAFAEQKAGAETVVEFRVLRPDGSLRWVREHAVPVKDASGRVERLVGTMRDVTEARVAADKLREQAALLDKARDAILVRDLEHRITYWNKSAERQYGWTASEAIGRSARALLQVEPVKFDAAMVELLKAGEWSGELVQLAKGGRKLEIEGRWTLVRDEQGRPKAVLAINTDVTERKKLEAQFLRAQRMESIGTLAGGIAHDLNNLLAPITIGVDLLRMEQVSEKGARVIDNIERSTLRGASLVKQVLSFARGMEGARVSIQVRHVIREIEAIVENTFPKNITLEVDYAPELWPVVGDPTQVNQVLLNLCVNARDAMPDGGRLAIRATNATVDAQFAVMHGEAAPGRYTVLAVEDNGTGIPHEIIDRIFEPFFTTKEQGKGTGLGLSTVIGIVRSHGGFVNVQSEPGRGSTFRVYLPAAPDAVPAGTATPFEEKYPRGQGELLLVVDDEASILSVTRQTLETFGYRTAIAEDGAQAIAIFASRASEVALVLTDMMMPVMDGPALIAALRRIEPQVKVIAASGLGTNQNTTAAARAGVRHFLPKPYSADALLQLIRKVLNDRATRPPIERG